MRRLAPSFGSAIQAAAFTMSSALTPQSSAACSGVVRFAASASSKPEVEASMKARSIQPWSATWVSIALKSARSVPELIARCSTLSAPAAVSHAFTVTVRRGSTITTRAAACGSSGSCSCFLAIERPSRFGIQWLRK